ncbi:hypothetical protein M0R04_07315 [Candidatus Dojkabacteria bacterium]|jgi:hypothetical protein|nr:hypothetical protein [Candidatus Dojkabacteria bacterium]
MMGWDINDIRRIAGIYEAAELKKKTLNEAYDEDDSDDEDPDVKRAEKELKKRKIALPKTAEVDVDKDIEALANAHKSRNAKQKAAKNEAHEKAESPAKEKAEQETKVAKDEKKETPTEEKKEEAVVAKRKGKAPQESSKSGQLRSWIKANGYNRKEAWKAAEGFGMTKSGFSTIYQSIKNQVVKEGYLLRHPHIPSYVLHENRMMNLYQWISENSIDQEPVFVQTIEEAEKIATYLKDYKNQLCDIEKVQLED